MDRSKSATAYQFAKVHSVHFFRPNPLCLRHHRGFTTFLEFAGVTNLDGSAAGTTISITPGIRFWLARANSITFGIDFPLTTNPAYSVVYRLNYILNF